MKSTTKILVAAIILTGASPSFATMILLSEVRSVTASYYGSGRETHTSPGSFGNFEANARGTPFGGGSVYAYQHSNITPTEFNIVHTLSDDYGPGGEARSDFVVNFQLLEYTRITIDGYCNMYSGFAGLVRDSESIPLIWTDAPGSTSQFYRNCLTFDQVLQPGFYTFSTFELPRETVTTRIVLRATTVPDVGSSASMLVIGLLSLVAVRYSRAWACLGKNGCVGSVG